MESCTFFENLDWGEKNDTGVNASLDYSVDDTCIERSHVFGGLAKFDGHNDDDNWSNIATSLVIPTIEKIWESCSALPTLVHTGFHAYQKDKCVRNTKVLSFEMNKLFVTNQNKTGLLYFIIEKSAGALSANLEMTALPTTAIEFQCRQHYARIAYENKIDGNTLFLYRISPVACNVLPSNVNVLSHSTRGKFTTVHKARWTQTTETGDFILGSSQISFPNRCGKYIVEIYPIAGLNSRSLKDRPMQFFSLYFPLCKERFTTMGYKMVSKDQDSFSSIPKIPKKRKRDYVEEFII